MMTSSPGLSVAIIALKSTCLPPVPTMIWLGLYVEAVLALELRDDRRLQLGDAVDGGVLGLAVADRLDRGFLDVVGRVEIGLAGAEPDDVAARRFQLARLVGDGDGRRTA